MNSFLIGLLLVGRATCRQLHNLLAQLLDGYYTMAKNTKSCQFYCRYTKCIYIIMLPAYIAIAVFKILDDQCSFWSFLGNHKCFFQLVNARELIWNQCCSTQKQNTKIANRAQRVKFEIPQRLQSEVQESIPCHRLCQTLFDPPSRKV